MFCCDILFRFLAMGRKVGGAGVSPPPIVARVNLWIEEAKPWSNEERLPCACSSTELILNSSIAVICQFEDEVMIKVCLSSQAMTAVTNLTQRWP